MSENILTPPTKNEPRRGLSWLHVLFTGIVLFVVSTVVMFLTSNPNLFPTVILIGNFLVPVVFVAFLYDHQHLSSFTPETIARSFCVGGILGVLGASVLEYLLLPMLTNPNQGLSLSGGLAVGLIEEGVKILAVIFLARHMHRATTMDGLLLGAAVGMGFAAFESTGYAFTAFLLSQGHVGASIAETVIRGLLAPFGHGIWTGILAAVLFRERRHDHFRITGLVILTYLFVSALHGLWDGLPRTIFFTVPPGIHISLVTLTLSVIGIVVFVMLYRRAKREEIYQPPTV